MMISMSNFKNQYGSPPLAVYSPSQRSWNYMSVQNKIGIFI